MTSGNFRLLMLPFATLLTLMPVMLSPTTIYAGDTNIRHVLVISVDGMHSLDLALWAKNNPGGALGRLYSQGMRYTNASTTKPSDSIPSTVGIFTGASPAVGGMYYDDAYNRAWFPPGSNCLGPAGAVIDLKQGINLALDGSTGVDPNKVPLQVVNGVCTPVLPHNMIRVNTVFEVVKSAHWRTAYSEKRPSYDFLNGPSGTGVDDLYTPEIACFPFTPPSTCTNALLTVAGAMSFDELRVKSVLNEIDGKDHSGTAFVGAPALFGMNFQVVNAAKKDSSVMVNGATIVGGYQDDIGTPNPDLTNAIAYVDSSIGRMMNALAAQGLSNTTAIIITAKHGETSLDPTKRFIESTSAIQTVLTANNILAAKVAKLTEKSTAYLWLKDQSLTAGITNVLTTKANETTLNIAQILSGESLKLLFTDPLSDPAPPDIVIVPNPGTNYEPPTANPPVLAEHGGFNENDVHVPLVVFHAPSIAPGVVRAPVATTQIAPTILALLRLDVNTLQAVRLEGVRILPGIPTQGGVDNGVSPH
jgi:hypothetical protein